MILDVLNKFIGLPIFLASSSPRRIELLQNLGFALGQTEGVPYFLVKPSKFAENLDKANFTTPANYATATATGKADDVLNNELSADEKNTSYLLIACDTVVESPEGEIFEKPKNEEDAARMLRMLSNKTHRVHSGVVVFLKKSPVQNYQRYSFSETTDVSFEMIPESLILSHSKSTVDHDKAGGYAIQGRASAFCKEIKGGSYANIVGLPIHKLGQILREISNDL